MRAGFLSVSDTSFCQDLEVYFKWTSMNLTVMVLDIIVSIPQYLWHYSNFFAVYYTKWLFCCLFGKWVLLTSFSFIFLASELFFSKYFNLRVFLWLFQLETWFSYLFAFLLDSSDFKCDGFFSLFTTHPHSHEILYWSSRGTFQKQVLDSWM